MVNCEIAFSKDIDRDSRLSRKRTVVTRLINNRLEFTADKRVAIKFFAKVFYSAKRDVLSKYNYPKIPIDGTDYSISVRKKPEDDLHLLVDWNTDFGKEFVERIFSSMISMKPDTMGMS